MSPILVRPVREQLEHDRVIRLLQAKYKRKYEVGINVGAEQVAPVGVGTSAIFPDLVLQSTERGRKLLGVIEVETSESINHLEAMSQWASLGRLRVPFYLYVPANSIDTTRRLCADLQIPVAEIWTFHPVGDQIRFTMIARSAQATQPKAAQSRPAQSKPAQPKPVLRAAAAPARRASPPAPRRKPVAKPRARTGSAAAKTASSRPRAPSGKAKKSAKPARAQKRK